MGDSMRKVLLLVWMAFEAALCSGAEVYPSRPVRVIVPSGPGGGTDIMARVISQQLSERLGKSFVVDGRPGAGGRIGADLVAKSAPNGYTLYMAGTSFATNAALYRSLPYDSVKDFAPIAQFVRIPSMLVVTPSLKVNTLREFIALAQASPGKLNYGSPGIGASNQLMAELFKSIAKVDITFISYSGGGDLINAMLAGEVQMIMIVVPTVQQYIKTGQLRALAITTDGSRSPVLPDVPSFKELGIPNMVIYTWLGLSAPAGTPKAIINKLHAEVVKAIAVPAVKEKLAALGGEASTTGPEEFAELIRSEIRRWTEVVRQSGIKVE